MQQTTNSYIFQASKSMSLPQLHLKQELDYPDEKQS